MPAPKRPTYSIRNPKGAAIFRELVAGWLGRQLAAEDFAGGRDSRTIITLEMKAREAFESKPVEAWDVDGEPGNVRAQFIRGFMDGYAGR